MDASDWLMRALSTSSYTPSQWVQAKKVACPNPACEAPAGKPCKSSGFGRPDMRGHHVSRYEAAGITNTKEKDA